MNKKNVAEQNKNAAVQDEWDEHDFTALLEFRDIEDELGTLSKLFHKQTEVVTEMINHYDRESLGYSILESVLATLDGYMTQHHEMIDRASAGHESVRSLLVELGRALLICGQAKTLLDMKQKQANVDEARQARVPGSASYGSE